ncbi:MAG: class I poly(R)-hydroxyalkanoic acid synthase, partial [Methylobacteriaceae bacterium]|nr:class I poly(R)-hydroxyalkanoic acid synthase [Methylobacteriaceae bacterium]
MDRKTVKPAYEDAAPQLAPRVQAPALPPAEPSAEAAATPEAAPQTQGDLEALAVNLARLVEESGNVAAAYLKPREAGEVKESAADQVADAVKTLGHVAEFWLSDPARAVSAQTAFTSRFIEL